MRAERLFYVPHRRRKAAAGICFFFRNVSAESLRRPDQTVIRFSAACPAVLIFKTALFRRLFHADGYFLSIHVPFL